MFNTFNILYFKIYFKLEKHSINLNIYFLTYFFSMMCQTKIAANKHRLQHTLECTLYFSA